MTLDPWAARLSEYLDDELQPDERAALDRHLAGCPSCRELLRELERVVERARSLRSRPPQHDLWPAIRMSIGADSPAAPAAGGTLRIRPAPRRFASPRLLAVAASLAAVVTLGVTLAPASTWSAPAREWVLERLTEILAPADRAVPAAPAAPPTPAVHFLALTGDDLVLSFARHQSTGSLEVRVAAAARASIRVVDGHGEAVETTTDGFRILNAGGSAASYLVTVPQEVLRVRVQVGDPADEYVIRDLFLPVRWVFGLQEFPDP
jgi:hypothetical protein